MKRKKSLAEERTIGLYSGKTKTNEELAAAAAHEELEMEKGDGRPPLSYDDAVMRGMALVEQDKMHDGEDVLFLQHPTGGVLMVATQGPREVLSHYVSVFLTAKQVQKLRVLLAGHV